VITVSAVSFTSKVCKRSFNHTEFHTIIKTSEQSKYRTAQVHNHLHYNWYGLSSGSWNYGWNHLHHYTVHYRTRVLTVSLWNSRRVTRFETERAPEYEQKIVCWSNGKRSNWHNHMKVKNHCACEEVYCGERCQK